MSFCVPAIKAETLMDVHLVIWWLPSSVYVHLSLHGDCSLFKHYYNGSLWYSCPHMDPLNHIEKTAIRSHKHLDSVCMCVQYVYENWCACTIKNNLM